jgi:hypothetical protein
MGTRKRITIAKPPFLTTFVDQASQSSRGMAIIVEGNSKNERTSKRRTARRIRESESMIVKQDTGMKIDV